MVMVPVESENLDVEVQVDMDQDVVYVEKVLDDLVVVNHHQSRWLCVIWWKSGWIRRSIGSSGG